MPLDLTDDKSTLAQVMAWCHQATSHYMSQCWPRSMSSNGIHELSLYKPYWSWKLWGAFGMSQSIRAHCSPCFVMFRYRLILSLSCRVVSLAQQSTTKCEQCAWYFNITMTSLGVSNYWQPDCLSNSLLRLTSKKTSRIHITGPLWRESTSDQWIPLTKGQLMQKACPCYGTITTL